ncbi:MAG: hypothetical protein U1B77_00360, partial [Dehalococcoidales bacterium]|nr:hypothetical protein [Dehalococcoidales bacterium]
RANAMPELIKVVISGSCEPCQEVKQLISEGRFNKDEGDVDLIDLETEEGFGWMEKLGLTQVPTAYKGKKRCDLRIDDKERLLVIDCDQKESKEHGDE